MRLKEKLLTSLLLVPLAGTSAWAKERGNFDAFLARTETRTLSATETDLQARGARVEHAEERLGVPTVLWNAQAGAERSSALATLRPDAAARTHLQKFADLYRLSSEDVSSASLNSIHKTEFGPVIARFGQKVDGVEVFRSGVNVVMDRNNNMVAITGYLAPHESVAARLRTVGTDFQLSAADAVARAFKDLTDTAISGRSLVSTGTQADYTQFSFEPGVSVVMPHAMSNPARAKKVYFTMPDGLQPAWYVELNVGPKGSEDSDYFSYVLSATDGSVLFRNNLTVEDSFTYRVWAEPSSFIPYDGPQGNAPTPHPTGNPDGYQAPFVASNLITLQNAPFSRNDPWLVPGATQTTGNNADAYADLGTPDGFQPESDLRADVSAPGTFDYTYDVTKSPSTSVEQRKAAIVQLFYMNNWLHDWYYDAGFDEAAGNAQASNYGRGGLDNDSIKAEAQDFGGRNNANMSTPSDGQRPRMQMYVFNGVPDLKVTAPGTITGGVDTGSASFGPTLYDLSGDLKILNNAGTTLGCTAFAADTFKDMIALIDRGSCDFNVKAKFAQDAGAKAVIIADNAANLTPPGLGGTNPAVTIPTLSVTKAKADAWKTEVRTNSTTISLSLKKTADMDRDGTIDNAIVAHEWGHYISNRLVGNANGLTNNQGRAMGEGWADFHAMLMAVRAEDKNLTNNGQYQGVYAMAAYTTSGGTNNGYYWGIRRAPYSTDMGKNGYTFKHIANGNPLPALPVASGANGAGNSQVHASGEVWSTMLWECYAALLNRFSDNFPEAQNRMKSYLVAAYKATPNAPTMLEARDALLSVAAASDMTDHDLFAAAFAKRGAGFGAKAPDRNSVDHVGVVESFEGGSNLEVVSARLDDAAIGCDKDGVLDVGETGLLTLTVRNTGSKVLNSFNGTVTASGATATIEFPNGNTLSFPGVPRGGTATRSVQVKLTAATGTAPTAGLTVTFDEPSLPAPAKTAKYDGRVHYDEVLGSSASDNFESSVSAWTYTNFGRLSGFAQATETKLDGTPNRFLHGPDHGVVSDTLLTSPWMQVNPTGNFILTYKYRHSLEGTMGSSMAAPFYDGVVLELTDDGTTWYDVFADLGRNPGYANFLAAGDNPLAERPAYVGTNAAWPNWSTATVNLGTIVAGANIRVRLRIGTDPEVGAYGFDVDDVTFTNVANTPFGSMVAETSDGTTCNQRPVADAGQPSRSVTERDGQGNLNTITLNGSASFDPDGQAVTYAWTQLAGPAVTLSSTTSATPTFTADVSANTTFLFQLVVSDGTDSSLPKTTAITVINSNRKPVASATGPGSVPERSAATITLDGSGSSDADGEGLNYMWTQTGGDEVVLDDPTSALPSFPMPEVSQDATYTFQLVVNDGLTDSTATTVTVTVANVDRSPTANAGDDRTVDSRSAVSLAGSGGDADGDAVTYAWAQTGGTPAVTLTGADTATASFTAPSVRTDTALTFELTVTANGQTTTDSVVITVKKSNRRPVGQGPAAFEEKEGTAIVLDASGSSDEDGDPLTYKWTQIGGPSVQVTGNDTNKLSLTTPEVSADTMLAFTLVVTDTDNAKSDVVPVTIKVLNVNKAPTAQARKLGGSAGGEVITLDASGSKDPDGEALTYQWEQTAGQSVTLSSDREATVTFEAPKTEKGETFSFKVTVTDSKGLSASQTVDVAVVEAKDEGGCSSTGNSSGGAMLLALLAGLFLSRRRITLRA